MSHHKFPCSGKVFSLQALKTEGLDQIYVIAPTSTAERIQRICDAAGGFVYYVSVKGVTGASHLDLDAVEQKLEVIRAGTDLPVGVGFGVSTPETAAAVAEIADAVVVGSAIVSRMEQNATHPERLLVEVPAFVGSLRAAMDRTARPASVAS